MFKTPSQYADMLIDLHMGKVSAAMAETFAAAREYPSVPKEFFRDVFLAIVAKTTGDR